MELRRQRRQLRRELGRNDIGRRNTSPIQALERLDLAGLQTLRIARYFFCHSRGIYPLQGQVPRI